MNIRVTDEQMLVFDIAKFKDPVINMVIGRQGDSYQKTTDVQLLAEGIPYDLTKTAVIGFKAVKPDKSVIADFDHGKITDAANGKFTYSFPSGCFSVEGDYVNAYFTITGYDGTVDSTNNFQIKVIKNLVDQTIVTGDYVGPIDQIIDYGKKKINDVSETLDNLVTSTKKTIDELIATSTEKIDTFI
ncbi:BppU family phage baseplate upper protein, partial [Pediococcus stilesii]